VLENIDCLKRELSSPLGELTDDTIVHDGYTYML